VGLGEEEGEIAVKKSENISKYFPSTLQPKWLGASHFCHLSKGGLLNLGHCDIDVCFPCTSILTKDGFH
jgi:hypothetical protein